MAGGSSRSSDLASASPNSSPAGTAAAGASAGGGEQESPSVTSTVAGLRFSQLFTCCEAGESACSCSCCSRSRSLAPSVGIICAARSSHTCAALRRACKACKPNFRGRAGPTTSTRRVEPCGATSTGIAFLPTLPPPSLEVSLPATVPVGAAPPQMTTPFLDVSLLASRVLGPPEYRIQNTEYRIQNTEYPAHRHMPFRTPRGQSLNPSTVYFEVLRASRRPSRGEGDAVELG